MHLPADKMSSTVATYDRLDHLSHLFFQAGMLPGNPFRGFVLCDLQSKCTHNLMTRGQASTFSHESLEDMRFWKGLLFGRHS